VKDVVSIRVLPYDIPGAIPAPALTVRVESPLVQLRTVPVARHDRPATDQQLTFGTWRGRAVVSIDDQELVPRDRLSNGIRVATLGRDFANHFECGAYVRLGGSIQVEVASVGPDGLQPTEVPGREHLAREQDKPESIGGVSLERSILHK
jgi:hypothetical protein